ncbi:MAG TPA: hypothetical protein VGN26_22505 [Armatimonadota bacterium]|jgi:hypothetical protein
MVRVEPPVEADQFVVRNVSLGPVMGGLPWDYILSGQTLTPSGVPGQNMSTPAEKRFDLHYVVLFPANPSPPANYVYYDASYGVTYTGASVDAARADFRSDAVGAWLYSPLVADPSRVDWLPRFSVQ